MLNPQVELPVSERTINAPPEASRVRPAWWGRVVRVEWLGQTAASLCWIASVFAYGIGSTGDVLQLCAASAWLTANIAVVAGWQQP